MKKWSVLFAITLLAVTSAKADAESIAGRIGITGQLGFATVATSNYSRDFVASNSLSDEKLSSGSTFAGGGGLILGLTRNVAIEAGALYLAPRDYKNAGVKALEIENVDVSLGLQLRNNVSEDIAAYLGGGVDVLLSSVKDFSGNKGKADTVVGGHVNVGGDYFVSRHIALNLDLRGLIFPDVDLKSGGTTVAEYDPISFVGLVGVRFFLN
ncbi:outer membrane beta-barrel protein [Citrifermentans bremense]|uniref:outer membrane beta-barrel protein n=1 Tax=Citrifermentans bremense TaxID=60035 RepID=UPI000420124D|nr:outer membrane beta-barrel protein [Citrifermentans bremense]